MTQKLFGLDIAKLVSDNIAAAGDVRDCTLTKTTPGTRTGGSLTAGTNPTTSTYACKGFVSTKQVRRKGTIVPESQAMVVSLLGATVSSGSVDPEVNDVATIDDVNWTLNRLVKADPAGALYEFEATGTPVAVLGNPVGYFWFLGLEA